MVTLVVRIIKVQGTGWEICHLDERIVDGYALVDGRMTHASKYTTAWESKLDDYLRFQHVRTQHTSQLPWTLIVRTTLVRDQDSHNARKAPQTIFYGEV